MKILKNIQALFVIIALFVINTTTAFASIPTIQMPKAYTFQFPIDTFYSNNNDPLFSINVKIEVKGLKINQIYWDNHIDQGSFGYSLLFTTTTVLTPLSNTSDYTLSNVYNDYQVTFSNPVNSSLSGMTNNFNGNSNYSPTFGEVVIANNDLLNNNTCIGSASSMGFAANSVYTDTASLNKFMYDCAKIRIGMNFNVKQPNTRKLKYSDQKEFATCEKIYAEDFGWDPVLVFPDGKIPQPNPSPNVNLGFKLTSFGAKFDNSVINIDWKSAEETNLAYYEIEKSTDSKNWNAIATVIPNEAMQYQVVDNEVLPTNYYRIKSTDNDGSINYSTIVRVNTNVKGATISNTISVVPNPATSSIKVKATNATSAVIMNMLGQEVMNVADLENAFDISSLNEGIYMIKAYNNNELVSSTKFIKQ